MPDRRAAVLRIIASRVSMIVGNLPAVIIHAPLEYMPMSVARVVADELMGIGYIDLPPGEATVARILSEMAAGRGVLASFGTSRHDEADLHRFAELFPMNGQSRLLCVAVCHSVRPVNRADLQAAGILMLDHRDLVLSAQEMLTVFPELSGDPAAQLRLITETGGVPELVVAAGGDVGSDQLAKTASQWADREGLQLVDNPLVGLHAWFGMLSEASVSILATSALGRPATVDEIRLARQASMISSVTPGQPAMPDALAKIFRQRWAGQGYGKLESVERILVRVACAPGRVSRFAAIRLLLHLEAWQALDLVLSDHLYLAIHLTVVERQAIIDRWPVDVPRQWRNLARVRSAIDRIQPGHEPLESLSGQAIKLLKLVIDSRTLPGSLAHEASQQIRSLLDPRVRADARHGSAVVIAVSGWLQEKLQNAEAELPGPDSDDIALLVETAGLVATLAMELGALGEALLLARVGLALVDTIDQDYEIYLSMKGWALAIAAMTAACAGLPESCLVRLRQYDQLEVELGWSDSPMQRLADLARRSVFVAGSTPAINPPEFTQKTAVFIPQYAQAEATRLLLTQGVPAAIQWLQAILSRASWMVSQEWLWWPAHQMIILLDAQAGHLAAAQAWLARSRLPGSLALAVRANIDIAAGRTAAGIQAADSVLRSTDVPHAWRLIAVGAKIAALAADENDTAVPEGELAALLGAEDWAKVLGVVALFPVRAKRLITAQLPASVRTVYPGLFIPADTHPGGSVPLHLTQRQVEVLRELASNATMPEIARRMYLSPETVRSTAKQLYRRLGVHDRKAAVDLGKAQGLI